MGDMGHSRKQFNEIMKAAEIQIDLKTKENLLIPLRWTSLPPNFYVKADKSTVNRVTNQAVTLCCMVEGVRRAIPVQAPQVYSVTRTKYQAGNVEDTGSETGGESDSEIGNEFCTKHDASQDEEDRENEEEEAPNEVSGSRAAQLAKSMYALFEDTYSLEKSHLSAYWQGTSCSGQYQARDFASTLNELLNHTGSYHSVIEELSAKCT